MLICPIYCAVMVFCEFSERCIVQKRRCSKLSLADVITSTLALGIRIIVSISTLYVCKVFVCGTQSWHVGIFSQDVLT